MNRIACHLLTVVLLVSVSMYWPVSAIVNPYTLPQKNGSVLSLDVQGKLATFCEL